MTRFNNENVQNFFADLFCMFLIFKGHFSGVKSLKKVPFLFWMGSRATMVPWGPIGAHMGPTWGPCWTHVAPTWVPCWTHVGPTWVHIGPCWSKMVGGRCGLGGVWIRLPIRRSLLLGLVSTARPGSSMRRTCGSGRCLKHSCCTVCHSEVVKSRVAVLYVIIQCASSVWFRKQSENGVLSCKSKA